MFSQLEQPNEKATCVRNADLYNVAETAMVYRMWEVITAYQQPNDFEDATSATQELLNEFKDTVQRGRVHITALISSHLIPLRVRWIAMSISVCLSVYRSAGVTYSYDNRTAELHQIFARVAYGHSCVLRGRCDSSCTSGFCG